MPNIFRFTDDFLLPALNERKYGSRLKWDEQQQDVFLVKWHHKGANTWSEEDTLMFQDWDKIKGHYNPTLPNYLCQAKQRFRSVLYKLREFQELNPVHINSKCYYKRYQLMRSNIGKVKKCVTHSLVPDLERDASPGLLNPETFYFDNDEKKHHHFASPSSSSSPPLPSAFYPLQSPIADTAVDEGNNIKSGVDLAKNFFNFSQAPQKWEETSEEVEIKYEITEEEEYYEKFMSDEEVSSNLLILGDLSFEQLLSDQLTSPISGGHELNFF